MQLSTFLHESRLVKERNLWLPVACLAGLIAIPGTNALGGLLLSLCMLASVVAFRENMLGVLWRQYKILLLICTGYFLWVCSYSFVFIDALKDFRPVVKGWFYGLAVIPFMASPWWAQKRALQAIVLLGAAFSAGLAAYVLMYGTPGQLGDLVTVGGLNRNRVVVSFAFLSVMTYAFSLASHSRRQQNLGLLSTVITMGAIVVLGSRGAMAALAISLSFMTIASRRHFRQWLRSCWQQLAGYVAILLTAVVGLHEKILQVMTDYIDHGQSDQIRTLIWTALLERFEQRPLTGWGLRSFQTDPWLDQHLGSYQDLGSAHSIYISFIYNLGIVGLALLATLLVTLRLRAPSASHLAGQPALLYRLLGVGLVAYILIHGLVNFDWFSLSIVMGLVAGWLFLFASRSQLLARLTENP